MKYKSYMDNLRGNGRTTRMIAEALKLAAKGHRVIVVAANEDDVVRLTRVAGRTDPLMQFMTLSRLPYEPDRMLKMATVSATKILFDHYAIELHFAKVLGELHRYD